MTQERTDEAVVREALGRLEELAQDSGTTQAQKALAALDRLLAERDVWREAFQGKQLYPISELEQKLAHTEGLLADAEERIEKLRGFPADVRAALDALAAPIPEEPEGAEK